MSYCTAMMTPLVWVKREFGDLKRDAVQIKWMLAFLLVLQVAMLIKLFAD